MKKLILLSILCFLYPRFEAQVVNWAVNTGTTRWDTHDLVTDPASNLYLFGYRERSFRPSPEEGSFIEKYSPAGQLLFRREWRSKLFIRSMINDGKGSFFFCGYFRDTVREAGISLTSRGEHDGFFGKMDENCNVEWTISFGGEKDDKACDLTFNHDSTEMVITGGINSTTYLYEYPIITTPGAIFVARFTLKGGLQSYRTYAFTPDEHGVNVGLEIERHSEGYYLLAERMGDHWNNVVPSGSPLAGKYIFRISNDLEIEWSQYIISSACYYGHSCRSISVHNDEVCVPSFCSSKYGGTGKLEKLTPAAGDPGWQIINDDGEYNDTYSNGTQVFYTGNEEANGCPCEDNNPGFARVKMLDQNNADHILLNKYGFHFYNVTQAPDGNIYIYGHTGGEDPHLQGHRLERGYFVFSLQSPPASRRSILPEPAMLSVHPNPSTGYAEIVHEEKMEDLTVINGSGATVLHLEPSAKACTIRDLERGYYIVRVKNKNGYSHSKLLVTK